MELVQTAVKRYDDYRQYLDRDIEIELDYYLQLLQGKKIAMVNSTAFGGGVAEILHSLVPLARDMGIKIDWWVLKAANEFYYVTKAFHNCLQGQEGELIPWAKNIFLHYNELNAADIVSWDYDIVVIHDPQPAPLINFRSPQNKAKWVWRCHIDTSTPNQDYWEFLYQFISSYDACIFTEKDFVKEHVVLNNLSFITPSIDPLSIKNIEMEREEAKQIISKFGVDIHRPLIAQISRFDPWKDPLGVIDAYKIVKKDYPSVQLSLVGSMATDDPEGWEYLYRTLRRAGEDYDIDIVTNFNGVSNREVNAFQTAAQVIIQKSIREGFGLTVTEGMWKRRPVVGGNIGGIKLQIDDEKNGYLVDTVEECAQRILTLLRNPALCDQMGEQGREKVRKNFLLTGHILNYLKLFEKLVNNG